MKRGHIIQLAILAALAVSPLRAQLPAFDATKRPACVDGRPSAYWLLNQSSATDCDATGGGAFEALCCCKEGSVSACASGGGGGNSFETFDAPAGTDPVADSSSDTLAWTVTAPLVLTGNSGADSMAFSWSGAFADAQVDGAAEGDEITISDLIGFANVAPYGLLDPLQPPTSAGTGGCIETFHGGAEVCHAAGWFNQGSATATFNQGSGLLLGDTTNELHGRAIAAATNADQTYTARVNVWFPGASTDSDMCGISVMAGNTLAAPSSVGMLIFGNQTTDGFWYITDTDYAPAAGSTTNASVGWFLESFRFNYSCVQLRYTDSSRELLAFYSTTPACTDWTALGTAVTLASDPLYWGYLTRRGGACRFQRIQLRTDANRNTWGTP
jgi:hypothetical protein